MEKEIKKSPYDEDFDMYVFLKVIWEGRRLILIISLIFALFSAIISLQINNYYSSHALLIPEKEESSMSSSIGGIASLAGINLGDGTANKTKEAIAVLNSRKFITDFIQKHNLNMPLLAAKEWDPISQELLFDESILGQDQSWERDVKLYEAYRKFVRDHYSISEDILDSGLITIRVQFISPNLSKEWVELLVTEINTYFKEKDIREANKSLDFLRAEVAKPLNIDLKEVLYDLIQEQTSIMVLANGKEEYMFRTVDPAYISDLKAGPMRSIYVILAFLSGMMLTIFSLFLAHTNNRKIEIYRKFPIIKITKI